MAGAMLNAHTAALNGRGHLIEVPEFGFPLAVGAGIVFAVWFGWCSRHEPRPYVVVMALAGSGFGFIAGLLVSAAV